jgi:hypothetical protein
MPKRWRVVAGGSFSWVYVDTDSGRVLAKSNERWQSRREVRDEIRDMKRNDDVEDDEDD